MVEYAEDEEGHTRSHCTLQTFRVSPPTAVPTATTARDRNMSVDADRSKGPC
jgi:hypothetical protein